MTAARIAAVFFSLAMIAASSDGAAPVRPVTDVYFGTAIVDPYRYMESSDPAYDRWTERQQRATAAMLQSARAASPTLVDRETPIPKITDLARVGDSVFYIQHDDRGNALMTCDVRDCQPRTVVQGSSFGASAGTSLGAFATSSDGRLVAVHVYAGSASSDIHVLRVSDGRDIELPLHDTVFDYIGFSADNRGIVYARAIGALHDAFAGKFLDYAHRLHTRQSRDVAIFGAGISKRVLIPPRSFAFVDLHERFAIAEVRDYAAVGSRFYCAPIETVGRSDTPWRLLGGNEAQYTDYAVRGTTIDLITHKNAPNYAIVRASLVGTFRPRIILPASNDTVISGTLDDNPKAGIFALNAARDADYVQLLKNGTAHIVRIPYTANPTPNVVPLPIDGSILGAAADPASAGLLAQMTSWTDPGDIYRLGVDGASHPLNVLPARSNSRFTWTFTAKAADGITIPVEMISSAGSQSARADARPSQSDIYPVWTPKPMILISAGAFGFSITPDYRLIPQAWLDAGGAVAVAHIRGGGEFGEDWHRAGAGASKPNSWNDLIASAQQLILAHVTTPQELDLLGTMQSYLGGTASSIAIGRAIEERPDLFSAAVIDAPSFDMLRAETTEFGKQSIPEFGTVTNRDGFNALLAMSPYAHVRAGANYPPILVRSFDHAYQIGDQWQAAKMVARWQAATGRTDSAYLDVVQTSAGNPRNATTLRADALHFFAYENSRAEQR